MELNSFSELYNLEDRAVMKHAEDSLNPKMDRVDEIVLYAKEAGIHNIGIANCISFEREAGWLQQFLENKGFKISRVNCKYGKMPMNDILENYKGISCNPAGQAKYLEENNTELNIMMGLCLGHDMIFNSKSKALVTPLIVKDRKLSHHTIDKLRNPDVT